MCSCMSLCTVYATRVGGGLACMYACVCTYVCVFGYVPVCVCTCVCVPVYVPSEARRMCLSRGTGVIMQLVISLPIWAQGTEPGSSRSTQTLLTVEASFPTLASFSSLSCFYPAPVLSLPTLSPSHHQVSFSTFNSTVSVSCVPGGI